MVFSHTCSDQYSFEYSKDTPHSTDILGSLSVHFSSLILSPMNPSSLGLSGLSNQGVHQDLPLFSLFVSCLGNSFKAVAELASFVYYLMVHCLSLPDAQCLKSHCFTDLLVVLSRRVKPVPVAPSWLEAQVQEIHLKKHFY